MADRLSLDAAAAIRAGMSYGNWKSLHPHTDGTMPEFRVNENFTPCEYCGAPFVKKRKNKRYCSVECSSRASKQRNKEKIRAKDRERRAKNKKKKEQACA